MKKLLSVVLVLVMVFTIIPLNLFGDFANAVSVEDLYCDTWDGSAATSFARGDGSEENPYIIETAEQLAYLAQTVNNGNGFRGKYIELIQDIDLADKEWVPIGVTRAFYGVFEGNGHSIGNLRISQKNTSSAEDIYHGVFGCNYGMIYDLNINSAEIVTSATVLMTAGLLAGYNEGTISGCDVSGSINSKNYNTLGGLCGENRGSIIGSSVIVTITVDTSSTECYEIGGLVGSNYGTINSCKSSGSIATNRCGFVNAGGLVGYYSGLSEDLINSCYSTVAVNLTASKVDATSCIGGLIGYRSGGVVSNCYATGNVYGSVTNSPISAGLCAGGLIGRSHYNDAVQNCYAGNSSVTATLTDVTGYDSYAGYLIGYSDMGSCATNCYYNSAMTLQRSAYVAEYTTGSGCDKETVAAHNELVSSQASVSQDMPSNTKFTYGVNNPRALVGWVTYNPNNSSSSPWIDNGNNPILCFEKNVSLTVRYSINGNVFKVNYASVYPGQSVSFDSPVIDSFNVSRANVSMAVTENTVIDVTYSRKTHKVNVICKDQDGKVIDTFSYNKEEGLPYTITPPQVTGYTPTNSNSITGNMGTEDVEHTVTYTVNEYNVAFEFEYIDGETVSTSYSATRKYGEELIIELPQVLGYKVITNSSDNITITENSIIVSANCAENIRETIEYDTEDSQWYTMVVSGAGRNLQDVAVTFDGVTKYTDKNGRVMFPYAKDAETALISIHKDGFSSAAYENEMLYTLKTDLRIDYFNLKTVINDNDKYFIQGISCYGNDIDKNYGVINVKYDEEITIVIKGGVADFDNIEKMVLVQEVLSSEVEGKDVDVVENFPEGTKVRKILQTIDPDDPGTKDAFEIVNDKTTGVCYFKLKGTQFSYKEGYEYPIYVYMYTSEGAEPKIEKLKISTIKFAGNFKVDGLFDETEVSLKNTGLSFLDGTKVSFALNDDYKTGLPFSIEVKNNEIYMAYDMSEEFKYAYKTHSPFTWNEYKKIQAAEHRIDSFMKKMASAVDQKFATGSWKDPVSKAAFKIDASAAGGICLTVHEGGKITTQAYLKVGLVAKASWTSDFVLIFIPITVSASISAEGEFTLSCEFDYDNQEIVTSAEVELGIKFQLSVGLGNRFGSIGAFGRLSIKTTLIIGKVTYFDAIYFNGQWGVYAKLDLGIFSLYAEKAWTFLDEKIDLVEEGSIETANAAPQNSSGYIGEYNNIPVYEASAYLLSSGQESENIPEWDVTGSVELENPDVDSEADVYKAIDNGNGRIISIGEQMLAVYFVNATDRKTENGKVLVYRVYDKDSKTWSDARSVDNNGTSDTGFDIIEYNGNIYIVYNEANCEFDASQYNNVANGSLVNDMAFSQEIVVAKYDYENKAFVSFQKMTNDNYYDSMPKFGVANNKLYLVWNKNKAHDGTTIYCMNQENNIYYSCLNGADWTNPVVVISKCYPMVDMVVSELSGNPYITAIIDEDASLYTSDDRNVYVFDLYGDMKFFDCYGNQISQLQAASQHGTSMVLWKSNNKLMALSDINSAPYVFFGEKYSVDQNYVFLELDENLSALLWAVKDTDEGATSTIYLSYKRGDNEWTVPKEFMSVPYHLMSFDVVAYDSQILSFLFTDTYMQEGVNNSLLSYSKLCYADQKLVIGEATLPGGTIVGPPSGGGTVVTPPGGAGGTTDVSHTLSIAGEYIIIGEAEYLSVRVENIGQATANGKLVIYRLEGEDAQTKVYEVDIVDLMKNNVKYYLIKIGNDDFFKATHEIFKCELVCYDDDDSTNNSINIFAQKLEGAAGTERDQLVEVPILDHYQQTFDKYTPDDFVLNITLNQDLRYVGCLDENDDPVAPRLEERENRQIFTFESRDLLLWENGTYELCFIYLTTLGYIDVVYTLDIVDTTPILIEGNIVIKELKMDDLIPNVVEEVVVDGNCARGAKLKIDTSSVNTDQLLYEWIINDTVVSTDIEYVVEQCYLGQEIYAKVVGVSPYYGQLVSQKIYIEKVERSLEAPKVSLQSYGNTVIIEKQFHIGDGQLSYGYSSVNDSNTVENWQSSNVLTLPGSGNYYLFERVSEGSIFKSVVSESTFYSNLPSGKLEINILSYGSELDEIEVELMTEDGLATAFECVLVGNNSKCIFEGVADNNYILVVKKANHVTIQRLVTVTGTKINLDFNMHLIGDVYEDGEIDVLDLVILQRYLALWQGYEDIISADAADINCDGLIDSMDLLLLKSLLVNN